MTYSIREVELVWFCFSMTSSIIRLHCSKWLRKTLIPIPSVVLCFIVLSPYPPRDVWIFSIHPFFHLWNSFEAVPIYCHRMLKNILPSDILESLDVQVSTYSSQCHVILKAYWKIGLLDSLRNEKSVHNRIAKEKEEIFHVAYSMYKIYEGMYVYCIWIV